MGVPAPKKYRVTSSVKLTDYVDQFLEGGRDKESNEVGDKESNEVGEKEVGESSVMSI